MTEHELLITPTEINLHKKSRLLEIVFSDFSRFNYSCEYLRVYSPASMEQALDAPIYGKKMVDIASIKQQGTSLLQLEFDGGYTGSYSWNTLHEPGVNYDRNWQAYLQKLKDNDLKRGEGRAAGADGKVIIKLLYFIQLASVTGRDEEDVEIPESVTNVESLLAW